MTGLIYSITCKVNGKRYVGQTIKKESERWREHIKESKTQSHRPLYRAINKYGPGMFTIRVLEDNIDYDNLSDREIYWIEQFDSYNSGYNLTTGGEQSYTIREDVKERISQTMFGVCKSEKHISNISNSLKRNNIGFTINGDGKHLRRRIKRIDTNTGEVVIYESLTDASNKLGLKNGNLSRGIKNGYLVGGYKWEKIDNKPIKQPVYGKRILDGKIIHHFDSQRSAARELGTGTDAGIRKAIKNPSRYSWKGCRWYYQDIT